MLQYSPKKTHTHTQKWTNKYKKHFLNKKMWKSNCWKTTVIYLYIYFFGLFRAPPSVYGSSRLGVKLELQLLSCATVTATQDPSCVFNLHCSSWQHWIHNPLIEARDLTHILMDTSQVPCLWATTGTPRQQFFSVKEFLLDLEQVNRL